MAIPGSHEPGLGQVRDEIMGGINLDHRVRAVEIEQATTKAELSGLKDEVRGQREDVRRMEGKLLAAIEATKPKPWPAVSGIAAAVALILVVAERLYS